MSVFVHVHGIKTVHAGGGSKNGKVLSTQLLNAPNVQTCLINELDRIGVFFKHLKLMVSIDFEVGKQTKCLYISANECVCVTNDIIVLQEYHPLKSWSSIDETKQVRSPSLNTQSCSLDMKFSSTLLKYPIWWFYFVMFVCAKQI